MSESPRVAGAEPSRKLSVSVVGLGRWGRNLARVFAETERASLHSVCDLDDKTWSRVEAPAKRETDFRRVLTDPEVEAIVIATPPHTHAELAVAAMEAGKHVLIEKPMALSVRDAERIVRTAARYRRRAMVGFVLRYHPATEALEQWVSAGVLGEVRLIRALRCGSQKSQSDPGPWWSLAPHDIDLVLSLMGQLPTTISASARSGGARVSARLSFATGCAAELTVGDGAGVKTRQLIVAGTRATAVFDDTSGHGKLRLYDLEISASVNELDLERRSPTAVPPLPEAEPLGLEAAHFVDGVLDGVPFRTDVVDGLRVVEVLQRGEQSVGSHGRTLSFPSPLERDTSSGSSMDCADRKGAWPSPVA